jgi:hypothetical protein
MRESQVPPGAEARCPYWHIVAAMDEGAATISPGGVIVTANARLGVLTGQPVADLADRAAQRAAEVRETRVQEALREQNAVLEQAQASVGLGWWSFRPAAADMLTWSPQAHRIFGITPEEFDGKAETLADLVHPDDRLEETGRQYARRIQEAA